MPCGYCPLPSTSLAPAVSHGQSTSCLHEFPSCGHFTGGDSCDTWSPVTGCFQEASRPHASSTPQRVFKRPSSYGWVTSLKTSKNFKSSISHNSILPIQITVRKLGLCQAESSSRRALLEPHRFNPFQLFTTFKNWEICENLDFWFVSSNQNRQVWGIIP